MRLHNMTLAPDSIEALCKRDPPKKTQKLWKALSVLGERGRGKSATF